MRLQENRTQGATEILMELGGIPIDRMTWRVIGRGEHYDRSERLTMLCFDKAPPIVERNAFHEYDWQKKTEDLAGIRFGRLIAIGYWGRTTKMRKKKLPNGAIIRTRSPKAGADGQLWVCRCLCGLFTLRTAKVIKKNHDLAHPFPPMCDAYAVEHVQKFGFSRDEACAFVTRNEDTALADRILTAMGIRTK